MRLKRIFDREAQSCALQKNYDTNNRKNMPSSFAGIIDSGGIGGIYGDELFGWKGT